MELGDYLIAKSGGGVRLVEDTMTEGLIARVMERRKAELNNVRTGINTYPYLPTQYWIYDIPALKFEI
ncbi:hypothetical protein IT418_01440 [bacterium]|nr:hypothetical protein [bacterium]